MAKGRGEIDAETAAEMHATLARLRMPPALPMSLAPLDGKTVLVCFADRLIESQWWLTDGRPVEVPCNPTYIGNRWVEACYETGGWWDANDEHATSHIPHPLGWLPLPAVLAAPVEDVPAPQAPERHKPMPFPEDEE